MNATPSTIRDFNTPEVDDTAYAGRHRNTTLSARVTSSVRDEHATELKLAGRPESYTGKHRVTCGCAA